MDEDGFDDLLGDMDDLDAALFGKKKPAPQKNMLSSILSNPSTGPRPTVSFLEESRKPAVAATSQPRSTFDDLFGATSTASSAPRPATAETAPRPRANLSNLFDSAPRASTSQTPAIPSTSAPQQQMAPTTPTTENSFEAGRIQKLEAEVERLNRELDDLKKRKRDDEEDMERIWKSRIEKLEKDHSRQIEQLRETQVSQLEKLESDQKIELDRMSQNYNRQLDGLTTSVGQTQDIVTIVDKVDTISATISRIAGDVTSSNSKIQSELDYQLRLREDLLEAKEKKFNEDQLRFDEERKKVHELNFQLNDIVKKQKSSFDNEKWKVREEFQKLEVERQLFKEDQQFILDNLAVEKNQLEKQITSFHQNQHDLLIRISTERQLLEQEKNEFYTKRNLDIKRIKNEASELDIKINQVGAVEKNLMEARRKYGEKLEQLQSLEISLMEECVEIDRLRNYVQGGAAGFQELTRRNEEGNSAENYQKNESVRATLKKHADYLDRYVGQKVAAVAPQNL
ncbi:unnamed protein product [Caenorhabditis angaria]|uniref:Fas-binding factor 1 C-terminal domain-containing protein n=1 Tax=Caenorhabditis angaria TaxID=860376 RepID=A0A9P1J1V3_9PELO|nr:unnamed protein product [Caenorhabditis angaria]